MLKKFLLCLLLTCSTALPFLNTTVNAKEADPLARVNWNININTGFYPYGVYGAPYYPGPYYYYNYPPYGYPCPPPYWVW